MAKRLNVAFSVTADTSQAKKEITSLQSTLNQIGNYRFNVSGMSEAFGKTTVEIKQASAAALSLQQHLKNATNIDTGKLSLKDFSKSLKNSGEDLTSLLSNLKAGGKEGNSAFLQLSQSLIQAETPMKRLTGLAEEMFVTFKNTLRWQITSSLLHGLVSSIQTAYYYSKDLNESLNNIRIVTGKSKDEMADFADEANKAAKELSSTTLEYTDAALIYFQQGDTDDVVQKKADITIKAANAAGASAEAMSEYLTAVWNSYKVGVDELESYVDKMAVVGAETASSLEEIATAMTKVAATANTVGVNMDQLTSIIATVSSVTRTGAETVGTAYKTILARMTDLKLGDTDEDGMGLGKVSSVLKEVGVDILDTSGELKDMGDVIEEVGDKWQDWGQETKVAVAEAIAGKRQYTQLMALFENWDMYQKTKEMSESSSGALDEMQSIFAESWQAASNELKSSMQTIYKQIFNDEIIIDFTQALTKLTDLFGQLIDGAGGFSHIILTLGALLSKVFSNKIISIGTSFSDIFKMGVLGADSYNQSVRKSILLNLEEVTESKELANALSAVAKMKGQITDANHKLNSSQKQILLDLGEDLLTRKQLILEAKEEIKIKEISAQKSINAAKRNAATLQLEKEAAEKKLKYQKALAEAQASGGKSPRKITTFEDFSPAQRNSTISTQTIKTEAEINQILQKKWLLANNINKIEAQGTEESRQQVILLKEQAQNIKFNNTGLLKTFAIEERLRTDTNELSNSLETIGKDQLNEMRLNAQFFVKSLEDSGLPLKQFVNAFDDADMSAKDLLKILNEFSYRMTLLQEGFNQDFLFFGDKNQEESNQKMQQYIDMGQDVLDNEKKSNQLTKEIDDINTKANETLKEGITNTEQFGTKVTYLASSAMALTSAFSTINNLGSIFSDEDLTTGEKLTQVLSGLSMVAFDLIMVGNSLKDLHLIETLIAPAFVKAKLAETVAIESEGVAATKTMLAIGGLKIALGPAVLIATAVLAALAFTISKLVVTSEEAADKISNLKDKFSDSTSEVEDLTSEIDSLTDSINKLYEQGSLTITEDAELVKLQAERDALEAQKELKEDINKLNAENLASSTEEYFDTVTTSASEIQKSIAAGSGAYANLSDSEIQQLYIDALEENLDYYQNYLDAQEAGIEVSEEAMLKAQQNIAELYKSAYGEDGYLTQIINPVSQSASVSDYQKELAKLSTTTTDWASMTSSELESQLNGINGRLYDNLEIVLDQMGISVQDYMQGLSDEYNQGVLGILAGQNLTSDQQAISDFLSGLTDEQYKLAISLAVDGDVTAKEFKDIFYTAYNNDVLTLTFETKLNQFENISDALNDIISGEGITDEVMTALVSAIPELSDLANKSLYAQSEALTNYILDGEDAMINSVEELQQAADVSISALLTQGGNLAQEFSDALDAAGKTVTNEDGSLNFEADLTIDGETYSVQEWLDQMSDIQSQIDDIVNSKDDAEITVTLIGAKALAAQAESIAQAGELISSDYKVAAEDVSTLAEVYPELLMNAEPAIDGTMQLNKEMVDSFRNSKNEELAIDAETMDAKLSNQIAVLQAQYDMADSYSTFITENDIADANVRKTILNNFLGFYKQNSADQAVTSQSTAGDIATAFTEAFNSIGQNSTDTISQVIENFQTLATASLDTANTIATGLDQMQSSYSTLFSDVATGDINTDSIDTLYEKYKELSSDSNIDTLTQDEVDTIASYYEEQKSLLATQIGELEAARSELKSSLYQAQTASSDDDSSSEANEKTIEELQEIEDRYHEINQEIKYQETLYKRLQKAVERAYGKTAINYLEQEKEAVERLYELNQQKADLYEAYTATDRSAAANLGATFDEDTGLISNYTSLVETALEKYNAAIATFNSSAQEDADQEVLDEAEATYNDLIDTLDQYEEQLNGWLDTLEEIEDVYDELGDIELQEIEVTLTTSTDQTDIRRDMMEYFSSKYEDSIDQVKDYYETSMSLASNYLDELNGIEEAYNLLMNSDYLSDANIVEQLTELISATTDSLSNIQDISNTLKGSFSDALSLAADELGIYTSQLEGYNSAIDNYVSILNLMGFEGDYDSLNNVLNAQANVLTNEVEVSKAYYETLLRQKQSLEEDYANGLLSADFYKTNYTAITEAITDAYDDYLSKTKETLEALQEVFTNSISSILQNYESIITGSSLDTLQNLYDKYSDNDEYLTSLEKTYELNKLISDINADLSDTEDESAKAALNNLKDEIASLEDKNKLSQYELEYLQAKYTATQKQIALEEAQNNKNTIKLARNDQGNYVPVFAADEAEITKAANEYEDALEQMYSLSADKVANLESEYLSSVSDYSEDMQTLIEDINTNLASLEADYLSGKITSESEYETLVSEQYARIDDLKTYYLEKFASIEEQTTLASNNLQTDAYNLTLQITGDVEEAKIAANTAIEESSNATIQQLILNEENWVTAVSEAADAAKEEIISYQDSIESLSLSTVGNYSDINDAVANLVSTSEELQSLTLDMIPELETELTQVQQLQEAWSAYAASIADTVSSLEDLLSTMQQQTLTYDTNTDYSAKMISAAYISGNESLVQQYATQRNLKLADNPSLGSTDFTLALETLLLNIMSLTDTSKKTELLSSLSAVSGTELEALVAKLNTEGFASGGYTGEWGDSSGKLAFLHQKEVVLNEDDTDNILKIIQSIENIDIDTMTKLLTDTSALLNNNLLSSNGNIISSISNTSSSPIIYADFPNATSAAEIEAAFNNIQLKASQYASKE